MRRRKVKLPFHKFNTFYAKQIYDIRELNFKHAQVWCRGQPVITIS